LLSPTREGFISERRQRRKMRGYELMYILEPTLDEEATKALIGQIEEFMGKQGVNIEATDPWGKRRLAYKIGRHSEGFYVLSRLKAEADAVSELERRLRVTDGVLRFLTVRVDKEQEKVERRRARKAEREQARRERRRKAAAAAPKSESSGEQAEPDTAQDEAGSAQPEGGE
jgi:small subunit ribosomal protein S6